MPEPQALLVHWLLLMAEVEVQIAAQRHRAAHPEPEPLYMTAAHLVPQLATLHSLVAVVLGDRKALERREAGGILHPT